MFAHDDLRATLVNLIIAIQSIVSRLHDSVLLVSLFDVLYHALLEELAAFDLISLHQLLVP